MVTILSAHIRVKMRQRRWVFGSRFVNCSEMADVQPKREKVQKAPKKGKKPQSNKQTKRNYCILCRKSYLKNVSGCGYCWISIMLMCFMRNYSLIVLFSPNCRKDMTICTACSITVSWKRFWASRYHSFCGRKQILNVLILWVADIVNWDTICNMLTERDFCLLWITSGS